MPSPRSYREYGCCALEGCGLSARTAPRTAPMTSVATGSLLRSMGALLFTRVELSYARRYYSSLLRRVKSRLAIFSVSRCSARAEGRPSSFRDVPRSDLSSQEAHPRKRSLIEDSPPGAYRRLPDSQPRAFSGQALSRSSHLFEGGLRC